LGVYNLVVTPCVMELRFNLVCGFFFLFLSGCAFKSINRYKDVTYQPADLSRNIQEEKLNVFAPRRGKTDKNVFVFIHGGGWHSGKKSLYNFFGNRMARKEVVVVVIDYPLAPGARYNQMAAASARAVQWVKNNIKKYGGDPEKIFIAGHSAGGHLAALITVENKYFDSLQIPSPIKGTILIDPAGLDLCAFLNEVKSMPDQTYRDTFTDDTVYWNDASPLYHLNKRLSPLPPMLIYTGEKTYPIITSTTETFVEALKMFSSDPLYYVIERKKHIPMITQFFQPWNPCYQQIIYFMNNNGRKVFEAQNVSTH
jgi:acetyl esterase/lipase